MKRIMVLTAAVMMAASSAFAQVNIGAGYSGTSMNPSEGDNRWYNGFNVSVGFNVPLGLGFEFSPSVEYNYLTRQADGALAFGEVSVETDNRYNEHYLNIPLMFNYGYEITPNARIFVFAGPTGSFGLYADCTAKIDAAIAQTAGLSDKKTTALWEKDSDYRRWDVKIGGGIGIDVCRHWRILVGYDYGLLNRTKVDDMKLHHHNLKAGVTYIF